MASSTAVSSVARPLSATSTPPSASSMNPIAANRPRGGPNGVNNKPRSHNEPKPAHSTAKETNTSDKHAHDRLLFLFANFVGRPARITVKNGQQFTGIFSGFSLESSDSHYVLKMVKKVPLDAATKVNGSEEQAEEYTGHGADHVMTFDLKDVVDLAATEISMGSPSSKPLNGTPSTFKTDTDISGNGVVRERELQRWEPSSDVGVDLSLSAAGNASWDQFETNERLYGVKTDYDESFYTTSIDRSHPSYKQKAAMAEKVAREIEGSIATNSHMAEERGQASERDNHLDEEDKYSGVKRDFSPLVSTHNRYTPPARRAPTGHTTVPGAPVDPAIISAQLVRPDSSSSRPSRSQNAVPATAKESQLKENVVPATEAEESTGSPATLSGPELMQHSKSSAASRHVEIPLSAAKSSTSSSSAAPARPPTITVNNGTTNVEKKVLNDFKEFAMHEKMRLAERGRENARHHARKEYEMKLNDLKRFAFNFKLKSEVPEDMLGILAKDKHKQMEIVEKSKKEAEQARMSTPVTTFSSPSSLRPEATVTSPGVTTERQQSRQGQPTQTATPGTVKSPQVPPLPSTRTGPGQLGQRLMAQSQHRDRVTAPYGQQLQTSDQRTTSIGPSSIKTEAGPSRSSAVASPSSAVIARFNVQAMEFKPNPAATAFSPRGSRDEGVASPSAKSPTVHRSPTKTSFFGNKRPCAEADRLSILDSFNPIARMKREGETETDPKRKATNGGIPQAYRTLPTWPVAEANKDKSYIDMFEKVAPISNVIPIAMAHQHQLPIHLQPGHHAAPQVGGPQQLPHNAAQHFVPGRDHHFDDHRMHVSSSTSSVFPSPRFQQPMLAYQPSPMLAHIQPGFSQPLGQYAMGPNGPVPQLRQFSGAQQFQGPHLSSTPMMINHSSGGSFMNMPVQQMPMFSPGQNGIFPGNGFSSPRMAPPMAHQNSQQGQGGQPYMYINPQQMFMHHPGQMQQMRPGMPVMGQNFPNSPHLQHQFPMHRGNSYAGNATPTQMNTLHNTQVQMQAQNTPAIHNESADAK